MIHSAAKGEAVAVAAQAAGAHGTNETVQAAAHTDFEYVPYLDLYLLSRVEVLAMCGTSFSTIAAHLSRRLRHIVHWEHEVHVKCSSGQEAKTINGSNCPPGHTGNASYVFQADAHAAITPSICASQVRNASSSTSEWGKRPRPFVLCHCDEWF